MESFGNHNHDPPPQPHNQLPTHSSGSAVFDASQYATMFLLMKSN
ncbi:unnamed protein product [Rhodiola kirilowii]